MNSVEELKAAGYVEHHSSLARGYHSTKSKSIYGYKGRFGEGFEVHSNYPKSSRYHLITYFVKEA